VKGGQVKTWTIVPSLYGTVHDDATYIISLGVMMTWEEVQATTGTKDSIGQSTIYSISETPWKRCEAKQNIY